MVTAGIVLVLASAGFCWQLLYTPTTSLRWDGSFWHLGPPGTEGDEPAAGQVDVAVDLGAWMLLRFTRETSTPGRSVTWLPTQRWGLEAQWHALRCAVYSPRPAPDAAQDPGAAADL